MSDLEETTDGWYVYLAMINDLGVDFAAKHNEEFFEVQVKSISYFCFKTLNSCLSGLKKNMSIRQEALE